MKIETTNQALLRQMEMRKINQCAIPAVYPVVDDKVKTPVQNLVRMVEAISRNRDYNEYLDRMAEAQRRESLYLYNRDRSISRYNETGEIIDIET